jgi:Ca2+/Na+ antiporter
LLDQILAPIVGGSLLIAGCVLIRSHILTWRRHQADQSLDRSDVHHFRSQFLRRLRVSGMLSLIGLLVAVGDALIPWQNGLLAWFAIYWLVVLLLAVTVVILGLRDMRATQDHARPEMARIQYHQRELERQLVEERSKRSNGQH